MAGTGKPAGTTLGLGLDLLSLPFNFLLGLVLGLAAPMAAIAAMVAGVRLLTGRFPFLSQEQKEGERYLSLNLVPPEEVSDLLAAQKKIITADLGKMQTEIQAILEETQATQGEAPEVIIEA